VTSLRAAPCLETRASPLTAFPQRTAREPSATPAVLNPPPIGEEVAVAGVAAARRARERTPEKGPSAGPHRPLASRRLRCGSGACSRSTSSRAGSRRCGSCATRTSSVISELSQDGLLRCQNYQHPNEQKDSHFISRSPALLGQLSHPAGGLDLCVRDGHSGAFWPCSLSSDLEATLNGERHPAVRFRPTAVRLANNRRRVDLRRSPAEPLAATTSHDRRRRSDMNSQQPAGDWTAPRHSEWVGACPFVTPT
jgi:hypothetical protein